MSALQSLRELEASLSTDDAQVWAEVIGFVFALGLFVRDNAHVVSALIRGVDPRFRDTDVTRGSPVEGLTSEPTADVSARLISLSLGIGLLHIALLAESTLFAAFLIAQALVPLSDPALYLIKQNHEN